MHTIKITFFFLLILGLHSCNDKSYISLCYPVIENVSPSILEKNGFNVKLGVDAHIYERTIEDTIFSYQFNNRDNLIFQSWTIKNLEIDNKESYQDALYELNLRPFGVIDSCHYVTVQSLNNNSLFGCQCQNDNELRITFYHRARLDGEE